MSQLGNDARHDSTRQAEPSVSGRTVAFRQVLMLRFILVNAAGAALSLAAYAQGWLVGLFAPQTWAATAVIAAVFVYGLAVSAIKVWQTSGALDDVRAGTFGAGTRAGRYLEYVDISDQDNRLVQINLLRLRLGHKISLVRQIANTLVFLGLIGTVIGFIIALSGVDPKAAGDANNIASMVGTLIAGMSVALYTTLLGAVLNLWLTINYRMLATGTINLLGAIVELGEAHRHARRP